MVACTASHFPRTKCTSICVLYRSTLYCKASLKPPTGSGVGLVLYCRVLTGGTLTQPQPEKYVCLVHVALLELLPVDKTYSTLPF